MIINEEGTYTLRYTATDDCGKTTEVDRELVVKMPPIYGVEWDGGESSAWARTDSSSLFAEPVPQHSDGNGGWTSGSSPFDDIMPWSGMQIVEDVEAGTLVSIPKFYYKWTRDGDSMKLQISPTERDGFLTSPAHADRGDGVGERDVVYVGRYHCTNVDFKSTTGIAPKRSITRSTSRSSISALGNDIWQYDFAMYWTICMLYLVEYADWNSQGKIGFGCRYIYSINNGETDAMTYHTGTNATAITEHGTVQYRHIEGLWSSVYDWVDGIYFAGRTVNVINTPSDFSDTSNGTSVGTRASSSNVIQAFTDPSAISGFEYALFPSAVVSDSTFSKYVCDSYNYNASGVVLKTGGQYDGLEGGSGLFYMNASQNSSGSASSTGTRLMKLPSA